MTLGSSVKLRIRFRAFLNNKICKGTLQDLNVRRSKHEMKFEWNEKLSEVLENVTDSIVS